MGPLEGPCDEDRLKRAFGALSGNDTDSPSPLNVKTWEEVLPEQKYTLENASKQLELNKPLVVYETSLDSLVVLEIPAGACTNLKRNNVKHRKTALFRCNRALVLAIRNWKSGEYQTSTESKWLDPDTAQPIVYRVGQQLATFPDFDLDVNKVCAPGIHFLLTKLAAFSCYYQSYPSCSIDEKGTLAFKGMTHKKSRKKLRTLMPF